MKKFFLPVLAVLIAGLTLVWADNLPQAKAEGKMSAGTITMPTPVRTPQAHHRKKKWITNGFGAPTGTPIPR